MNRTQSTPCMPLQNEVCLDVHLDSISEGVLLGNLLQRDLVHVVLGLIAGGFRHLD